MSENKSKLTPEQQKQMDAMCPATSLGTINNRAANPAESYTYAGAALGALAGAVGGVPTGTAIASVPGGALIGGYIGSDIGKARALEAGVKLANSGVVEQDLACVEKAKEAILNPTGAAKKSNPAASVAR